MVRVIVPASQSPEQLQQELAVSLRAGRLNHKFHYLTHRQTQAWLALHERYSPFLTEADGAKPYDEAFTSVPDRIPKGPVHVISLGCGGGQKDSRLLGLLTQQGYAVRYTPVDVGLGMVLTAAQNSRPWVSDAACQPVLLDLMSDDDLGAILKAIEPGRIPRVVLFFGMLPNFTPGHIAERLASVVEDGDLLLLSANLAPGKEYRAGVRSVLPLYDNAETRDWLGITLQDLGIQPENGQFDFDIEPSPDLPGLLRIVAHFCLDQSRAVRVGNDSIQLESGTRLRVLFSNRYQVDLIKRFCGLARLELDGSWLSRDGEEGVFACHRR